MQHDERQPTSGRPSLLSTEQQADADRNRKLGVLDAKPGAASGSMPGKRKYSLLAGALVAVVAIGAGSAIWLSSEGEKEIVLASSTPLPAAPAPAAPLASDLPAPGAEMDDVSTAAILEDAPPAEENAAAPALALTPTSDAVLATAQSDKSADDLTSMLERPPGAAPAQAKGPQIADLAGPAPAKPAPKSAAKPASKPAAKPAPKKPVLAKAAPAKATSKATGQKSGQKSTKKTAAAAAAAKKKAQAQPKPPQDTDVTLLAALVAHSKATAPKKAVTPAEKLRQCKTLGTVSQADQCRERLCASSAKNEAQCKAARLAKGPAES